MILANKRYSRRENEQSRRTEETHNLSCYMVQYKNSGSEQYWFGKTVLRAKCQVGFRKTKGKLERKRNMSRSV